MDIWRLALALLDLLPIILLCIACCYLVVLTWQLDSFVIRPIRNNNNNHNNHNNHNHNNHNNHNQDNKNKAAPTAATSLLSPQLNADRQRPSSLIRYDSSSSIASSVLDSPFLNSNSNSNSGSDSCCGCDLRRHRDDLCSLDVMCRCFSCIPACRSTPGSMRGDGAKMAFFGFMLVIFGYCFRLFWRIIAAFADPSSVSSSAASSADNTTDGDNWAQNLLDDWEISWMKYAIYVVASFGFNFVAFSVGWGQLILMGIKTKLIFLILYLVQNFDF